MAKFKWSPNKKRHCLQVRDYRTKQGKAIESKRERDEIDQAETYFKIETDRLNIIEDITNLSNWLGLEWWWWCWQR